MDKTEKSFYLIYKGDIISAFSRNNIEKYIQKDIPIILSPNKKEVDDLKEDFDDKKREKPKLKEVKGEELSKDIFKIHINAGRKTKMRPVDIVGTLCNLDGMTADDIGIINILDISTFVEILNGKGEMVLDQLQTTTIKGRLRNVNKANE